MAPCPFENLGRTLVLRLWSWHPRTMNFSDPSSVTKKGWHVRLFSAAMCRVRHYANYVAKCALSIFLVKWGWHGFDVMHVLVIIRGLNCVIFSLICNVCIIIMTYLARWNLGTLEKLSKVHRRMFGKYELFTITRCSMTNMFHWCGCVAVWPCCPTLPVDACQSLGDVQGHAKELRFRLWGCLTSHHWDVVRHEEYNGE